VVIMEDDDAYKPQHLETCLRHLERHKATGCVWLNYYNLKFRKWRRIRNSCAALCNTALRRESACRCWPMRRERRLTLAYITLTGCSGSASALMVCTKMRP
jgi:hypothetical protein